MLPNWIFFLIFTVLLREGKAQAQFPNISKIVSKGYQSRVEITAQKKVGTDNYFVDEYHDLKNGRGLTNTPDSSIYYNNGTNQAAVVYRRSNCNVFDLDELPILENRNAWGWMNQEKGIIGPSAVLFTHITDIKLVDLELQKFPDNKTFKGIPWKSVSMFTAVGQPDNLDMEFYFTKEDWKSADSKGVVPIRVICKGVRDREGEDDPITIQMDFVYFRTDVPSPLRYKIHPGIGCPGLRTSAGQNMPPIFEQFSFSLELYEDPLADEHLVNVVELHEMFYDGVNKIVQLTVNSPKIRGKTMNVIEDFNSGVSYKLQDAGEGYSRCEFGPIEDEMTMKSSGSEIRRFKTASEFLGLDGDYYFLGNDFHRGIYSNVWESVKLAEGPQKKIAILKETLEKAVFTYYFMSPKVESVTSGDSSTNAPIALIITGYKTANSTSPDFQVTYNFFKFDGQPISVYLGENFDVSACFEDESQRVNFMIHLETDEVKMRFAKKNHATFELESYRKVMNAANISPLRLPYLKIYYEPQAIGILGVILNRPPAVAGFLSLDQSGFVPTMKMENVPDIQTEEGCAEQCLMKAKHECQSFSFCAANTDKCYLTELDWTGSFGEKRAGQYSCSFSSRAVYETVLNEKSLQETIMDLKQAVESKKFYVGIEDETGRTAMFNATKIDLDIKPFNWQEKEQYYRELFRDYKLQGPEKSFTSFNSETIQSGQSVEDCYQSCADDQRLTCASFSYCKTRQSCVVSSVYVDPMVKETLGSIEMATGCVTYIRSDIAFFDKTPGKIPKIGTNLEYPNVLSEEKCAFWCKSDESINCKGFLYCGSTKTCLLQSTHILDTTEVVENQTADCVHYSKKYSSDFIVMARRIIKDPQGMTSLGISFEQCSKDCVELNLDGDGVCKSINYCKTPEGVTRCEMNTLNMSDPGAQIAFDGECLHYTAMITQKEIQFPSADRILLKGYSTIGEITYISGGILQKTKSQAFTEYNDVIQKRGWTRLMRNGARQEFYYFSDSGETAEIRGDSCTVSDSTTVGTRYEDYYINGLSSVWFRKTVETPVYKKIKRIRGVDAYLFEGIDADTKNTVEYYVTAQMWSSINRIRLGTPLRYIMYYKNSTQTMVDFTNFKIGIDSLQGRTDFMIPKGIGCKDLKSNGNRELPTERNMFSFKSERMAYLVDDVPLEREINMISVEFDNGGKVAKFTMFDKTSKQQIVFIQDYTTGTEYKTFDNGTCELRAIRNSWASDLPDGQVGEMINGKQFLGLDGYFYYLGQEIYRGMNSDVWETVKENVHFFGVQMKRLVLTIHFMAPDFSTAWHGDKSTRVPVRMELNYIGNSPNAKKTKMEMNIFAFDDAEGRTFYDDLNVEQCFTEQGQKQYFLLTFEKNAEAVKLAKSYESVIKFFATVQIAYLTNVSFLRIPDLRVFIGSDYLTIMGVMLERPPFIDGFVLYSDVAYAYKKQTDMGSVANTNACAKYCLTDKKCKGFTVCKTTELPKCFLSPGDITDTTLWETPLKEYENCEQYFETDSDLGDTEPSLAEGMKNLREAVFNRNVSVMIPDERLKDNNIMVALRIDESLKPFNWQDEEDLFETVYTARRLDVSKGTTAMEIKEKVGSVSDCYKRCIEEQSMSCSSFSYCKTGSSCRLSSVYLNVEDKKSEKELEADIASSCNVYKESSIRYFEPYPDKTTHLPGYLAVENIHSATECAKNCLEEMDNKCKGFEFCTRTKNCVLYITHLLDMSSSVQNNVQCTHYSKRHSLDYYEFGRYLLFTRSVGSTKERKELAFEECAKECSESDEFECKAFNYCKFPGEDSRHTCYLSSETHFENGISLKEEKDCSLQYLKQDERRSIIIEVDSKISSSSFAGTAIGLMILGIILGGVAFLFLSYFKSRHQNADGLAVRFVNTKP